MPIRNVFSAARAEPDGAGAGAPLSRLQAGSRETIPRSSNSITRRRRMVVFLRDSVSVRSLRGADRDLPVALVVGRNVHQPGATADRTVLDERTAGLWIHEQLDPLVAIGAHDFGQVIAEAGHGMARSSDRSAERAVASSTNTSQHVHHRFTATEGL